jgi:hypothetical protein
MTTHKSNAMTAINTLTDFIALFFIYSKNPGMFLTTTMERYISTPFAFMVGGEVRLFTITLN